MDLETYRKKHDLTLAALADLIGGVKKQQTMTYCTGHILPRVQVLARLLDRCEGVTADDIIITFLRRARELGDLPATAGLEFEKRVRERRREIEKV